MSDTKVQPDPARIDELNAAIRYTMYSVFKVKSLRDLAVSRDEAAQEVEALLAAHKSSDDVVVRGIYDLSGFRADAEIMIWWHAPTPDALQSAYSALRQSALGVHLEPVWSQMGLHRPAEFNRSHLPAFIAGDVPGSYICVYPFVRSYEWYLLSGAERGQMLHEHGALARDYKDVSANTVAAFALGDYEWLLAFEAEEMHRIVDLMRELRAAGARRHVREEVPFYSGIRHALPDLLQRMP